ncbi:MAG: patatin-like phospholipase family protein, partial [Deltaproteobacteria bacterium]|nr:patatin-like phospholipase family protein [Deltaproteobacteria bacterium]
EIPLLVVATDFWNSEEVVFDSGPLLPAIQASIAVPGVFAPVSIGDRVLVDGSVVNLVPYDLLLDQTDITIAVNVIGTRKRTEPVPNAIESVLGTFDILQTAVLAEKMKHRKPSLYVYPDISEVRLFEFNKIEEVFRQAAPAIETMKKQLSRMLNKRGI